MKNARRWIKLLLATMLLGFGLLAGLAMFSNRSALPELRPVAGRLPACPETPNCVSTQAVEPSQKMEPIPVSGDPDLAFQNLLAMVQALPRTRLVDQTPDYAHFEFTTAVFRFVDDVQFLLDRDQGVIQFRSASRVGRSDLGTNRRRMADLTKRYQALQPGN